MIWDEDLDKPFRVYDRKAGKFRICVPRNFELIGKAVIQDASPWQDEVVSETVEYLVRIDKIYLIISQYWHYAVSRPHDPECQQLGVDEAANWCIEHAVIPSAAHTELRNIVADATFGSLPTSLPSSQVTPETESRKTLMEDDADRSMEETSAEVLRSATDLPEDENSTRELGIAIYDIAYLIEGDEQVATRTVKTWSDGKRIRAQSIGKCPLDGRRKLYRLSEILSDIQKILSLSPPEVAKYTKALKAKLRYPDGQ